MTLVRIVEALLFASDAPLSAADIARAEPDVDEATVLEAIDALRREYDEADRAFGVYELAGGFQILTRPEFVPYLERFATVSRSARISPAALEALAIVAYRQPIGRAEIEEIRGVGSVGVLRTLAERDLIEVVGRGEGLGRPLLYGTTRRFLDHFGYASLDDLPRPEELPVVLRQQFALEPAEASAETEAGGEPEAGAPPDARDREAEGARLAMVVEAEVDRVVAAATSRPPPSE
ncbi:MAG: SMC-Scp complex subunit ScpB [Gemmatimonadota bacterium]